MKKFNDTNPPFEELVNLLRKGEIMVYPTETVAGIGSIGSIERAVKRLFQIKSRDLTKPVTYAFSSLKMIKRYAIIPASVTPLFQYLPGPLTLILPRISSAPTLYGISSNTIGVRIPNVSWLLELINKLDEPIITTSANISGQPPATKVEEVDKKILDKIDILISWKGTLSRSPSTVVRVGDEITVIREGSIPSSHIYELLRG